MTQKRNRGTSGSNGTKPALSVLVGDANLDDGAAPRGRVSLRDTDGARCPDARTYLHADAAWAAAEEQLRERAQRARTRGRGIQGRAMQVYSRLLAELAEDRTAPARACDARAWLEAGLRKARFREALERQPDFTDAHPAGVDGDRLRGIRLDLTRAVQGLAEKRRMELAPILDPNIFLEPTWARTLCILRRLVRAPLVNVGAIARLAMELLIAQDPDLYMERCTQLADVARRAIMSRPGTRRQKLDLQEAVLAALCREIYGSTDTPYNEPDE